MTYSQCKYKSVCPSYDQDSVKCTFFYNWCKIPKQTTNRLADEIFGRVIEHHGQQAKAVNHPNQAQPVANDLENTLGIGSLI
jgi:hypothetical protein